MSAEERSKAWEAEVAWVSGGGC